MAEGQFFKAASPQEACDLLAHHGPSARLLAGGTDLMVAINQKQLSPGVLIYIGDSGLDYIKADGDNILIGAGTSFSQIIDSTLVQEKIPLLKEVASQIASPAIRNMGSIGGNLANASPAADSATALLALRASLNLVSKDGQRVVAIEDYFTGPGKTVLKSGEMIKEAVVPSQADGARWAYYKLGKRRAQTLSVVSVAIYCPMDGDKCVDVRIALGAVAPTPIMATDAAKLLNGKKISEKLIQDAAKSAANATTPIDDERSTAWYRRRATEALVKKLLSEISL